MKLWFKRDSWHGTFWDPVWISLVLCLWMVSHCLFWLFWSSAAYCLGKSYIFPSDVFLARFPYGKWCSLASSARHRDSGWTKPLCACPALLWVKPSREPGARVQSWVLPWLWWKSLKASVLRTTHISCTVHHRAEPVWFYLCFDNPPACYHTPTCTKLGSTSSMCAALVTVKRGIITAVLWSEEVWSISKVVAEPMWSWQSQVMSCKLYLNKQFIYKAFSRFFCLSDQQLITSGCVSFRLELFLPSGFDLNHTLMSERNIFKDKRMVDAIFLL